MEFHFLLAIFIKKTIGKKLLCQGWFTDSVYTWAVLFGAAESEKDSLFKASIRKVTQKNEPFNVNAFHYFRGEKMMPIRGIFYLNCQHKEVEKG